MSVFLFTSLGFLMSLSTSQIVFPDTYGSKPVADCGKQKTDSVLIRTLVVGGMEIERGGSPWSALLGYRLKVSEVRKPSPIFHCGGTIITARFILTAAHCNIPQLSMARVGEHAILGNDDEPFSVNGKDFAAHPLWYDMDYDIAKVIMHPKFKESTNNFLYNDIALIKLKKGISFNVLIQPVCLPSLKYVEGRVASVVGYGQTEHKTYSDIPLSIDVKILDSETCKEKFKNEFVVDEFNPNLHLCDSGVIGENTCTGDSGAGLVVDLEGVHQVVGIVSGGTGVCGRGLPGYYARVYRYLSWIHRYV